MEAQDGRVRLGVGRQPVEGERALGGGFDYLQPHGGRRGLGDELYLENPRLAKDVLRHEAISTTQESYRERKAEQDAGEASRIVED